MILGGVLKWSIKSLCSLSHTHLPTTYYTPTFMHSLSLCVHVHLSAHHTYNPKPFGCTLAPHILYPSYFIISPFYLLFPIVHMQTLYIPDLFVLLDFLVVAENHHDNVAKMPHLQRNLVMNYEASVLHPIYQTIFPYLASNRNTTFCFYASFGSFACFPCHFRKSM